MVLNLENRLLSDKAQTWKTLSHFFISNKCSLIAVYLNPIRPSKRLHLKRKWTIMLVLLSPLTSRKMSDSITERSIEINTSGPYHRSINNNYNLSLYHTESELSWWGNVPLTKITDFVRKRFSDEDYRLITETFLWQDYFIIQKCFSNEDYRLYSETFL